MVKAVMSSAFEIRSLEPSRLTGERVSRCELEKADYSELLLEEIDRDFAVLASLCLDGERAGERRSVGPGAPHEARRQAKE